MRLDLGTEIQCADGDLGELSDIVVDPTTRRVTHLVVEPKHGYFTPRLVPVELVGSGDAVPIELTCTVKEAGELEHAEEIAYLRLGEFPVDDPKYDVQVTEMLALPYYEGLDMPSAGVTSYGRGVDVRYERVPKGEVEIRRKSPVIASDGHRLGHVDGLVVDDGAVTHVVLEAGHLWGKREITVPIGAVERVDEEGVTLTIAKDDVEKLDTVRLHRWPHGTSPRA
jgi:sporulation protein YlmC with PRC-barrel domain